MRACNLGSVEVTQQSAEVPHQMASWVIRLAIKTTESGRHQVTIAQFYFCPLFHERGSLFMDMARARAARARGERARRDLERGHVKRARAEAQRARRHG